MGIQSEEVRARRRWLSAVRHVRQGFVMAGLVAVGVLGASAVVFYLVERGRSPDVRDIGSGFVWVTRTLIQGEPPWEAVTGIGQVLFYIVVLAGVGLIAIGTGAIASRLIELVMRKDAGMGEARLSGHIVICGWGPKGNDILKELHAEEVDDKRPVVILAPLDASPSRDPLTTFVRGTPSNGDDLRRAGIERASTAIILADRSNPTNTADEIDAKTLLTTLAVESINGRCYTCVEVMRSDNREHFDRTHADELVLSGELTGALLANSALNPGLSRVISDLVTHPVGSEFYGFEVPERIDGMTFAEALAWLKAEHDAVLVAVGIELGHYELNPPADRTLRRGERLLVIASKDPGAAMASRDGGLIRTRGEG